ELRTPIAIMQTRIDVTPEGQDRRRLLDDVALLAETAEQLLDFERNNQAIGVLSSCAASIRKCCRLRNSF
ncbi:hypothetical protein ACC696_38740, partial [Rhizobium ruizarguesonis]